MSERKYLEEMLELCLESVIYLDNRLNQSDQEILETLHAQHIVDLNDNLACYDKLLKSIRVQDMSQYQWAMFELREAYDELRTHYRVMGIRRPNMIDSGINLNQLNHYIAA